MKNKIIHLSSIDSTQNYLKNRWKDFDSFTFVYTDEQTNGKGRQGHSWLSNKNENLTFSFLIKNKEIIASFNVYSIALGTFLRDYLINVHNIDNIALKWPNDILVNNKKIAGILLEGSFPDYIVVGIGLNANQTEFIDINATSISLETTKHIDIDKEIISLSKYIIKQSSNFCSNINSIIENFNQNNILTNCEVSYFRNGKYEVGTAIKINNAGALIVKTQDNILVPISCDEVKLIRKL